MLMDSLSIHYQYNYLVNTARQNLLLQNILWFVNRTLTIIASRSLLDIMVLLYLPTLKHAHTENYPVLTSVWKHKSNIQVSL